MLPVVSIGTKHVQSVCDKGKRASIRGMGLRLDAALYVPEERAGGGEEGAYGVLARAGQWKWRVRHRNSNRICKLVDRLCYSQATRT